MLVGFAGLLAGYDGTFGFESGAAYPDTVPYVAMRVMMASFGVAMVPLGWYTAVELGMSPMACHLVALMVLCGECDLTLCICVYCRPNTSAEDVAWLTISRFILLDSMLLFFTFTTVFFLTKFHNQQYQYVYAFLSARRNHDSLVNPQPLLLRLVVMARHDWLVHWMRLQVGRLAVWLSEQSDGLPSIKWIGFFVTCLVGAYTIEDLWEKFGDLKMSVVSGIAGAMLHTVSN